MDYSDPRSYLYHFKRLYLTYYSYSYYVTEVLPAKAYDEVPGHFGSRQNI